MSMLRPNEYDLAIALKSAPQTLSSIYGRKIHAMVIKFGFHRFTVLMTALLNFTFKYANLQDATKLFDEMPQRDVVAWTSLIVGYSHHKCYKGSLDSFRMMMMMVGGGGDTVTLPNAYTFSGALTACSGLQALKQGQQIHSHVLTSGLLHANHILQNSLLHLYCKCNCVFYARSLFSSFPNKGNIAWNEMIWAYLQCNQPEEAIKMFASMVSQTVKPDDFSYAICVNACASLASILQGSQFHACIIKTGFQSDLVITNSLIDMYSRCGCVDSAKFVFDATPSLDRLVWTSMISAYGRNGKVEEVLAVFEQMLVLNINPDEITYLVVLSTCSHGGLIEQGWRYFQLMIDDSLISVSQEHYACMVDLLCRSGQLLQAVDFIRQMPLKPGTSIWSTFLGFCSLHGNIELAQFAAEQLLELDPDSLPKFVPLSNVYALEQNWDETKEIRYSMESKAVKKEPGCSWIELKTGLHVFLTTDRSHPQMNEIMLTLKGLRNMCR